MTKRMLIDATHAEETRVVVLDGNRLEDFDVETSTKRQLKGNIYLAKVVRVEPSLQAAFVEYGGNRHGFLAFGEIHPDYYQIPVADRQRLIDMQAEDARREEEEEDRAAEAAAGKRQPRPGRRCGGGCRGGGAGNSSRLGDPPRSNHRTARAVCADVGRTGTPDEIGRPAAPKSSSGAVPAEIADRADRSASRPGRADSAEPTRPKHRRHARRI